MPQQTCFQPIPARHLWLWLFLTILLTAACQKDAPLSGGENPDPGLPDTIAVIQPEILQIYPHDSGSFTQGLVYHEGFLYESSGRYGASAFRKVAIDSGKVLHLTPLDSRFFGEGLALKGGRFVQLTWREHTAFVYDERTLARIDTFTYEGEGWGLASDGQFFIMSNGSGTLFFRDDAFRVTRTLEVTLDGKSVLNLNELEFVNGRIYANVWFLDEIWEISPVSGEVLRIIDCAPLVEIENPDISAGNVLNGIAYDPAKNTFFLTGKRWSRMFEVSIEPSGNRLHH